MITIENKCNTIQYDTNFKAGKRKGKMPLITVVGIALKGTENAPNYSGRDSIKGWGKCP